MNILGISAYYHDSAAALIQDGDIIAAVQEERFTRLKHDPGFPSQAIGFCLQTGGIREENLDYVVFYEKPLIKFDRLLESYLSYAPRGFCQFLQSMPVWLRQKLHLPREMDKALKGTYSGSYLFPEHHESHAASAFFPSPFEEAAILTIDGVGEWDTLCYGVGKGNRLTLTHALHFPHSLGLLYSAFTYFTGFKVNSGEYKLMGLAPYGQPRYYDLILNELMDLKEDGSFRLNMRYFTYGYRDVMIHRRFEKLFGGPARRPESPLTEREMDLAASIQKVTEEVMLRLARHVQKETGQKNLVLAGGVALNCVGNGKILQEGPFDAVWIQPASGDAGGALGAALFAWYQLLGNPRIPKPMDSQKGSLLGPSYTNSQIREYLDSIGAVYHTLEDPLLLDRVADLIAQENVVGWFQGRAEFGPRALGSRSILGDARSEAMQSTMNLKIKFRESFRPFAPCILQEDAAEYFQMRSDQQSPYMLLVAAIQKNKRIPLCEKADSLSGLEKLKVKRSVVPAITHVDGSARIQTVDEPRHGKFYHLLRRFKERTGCPVMINTSFNIRGEPIVCSPEHAYRCFMSTNMDVLVLENQILYKNEQPEASGHEADLYVSQFQLD